MWYVYLLRCSDNSLYCGITKDLDRRIYDHNNTSKSAKYTRSRRPVKLVWFEKSLTRSTAQKLEYKIKKLKKIEKEMIVASNDSLCTVLSSSL